MENNNYKDNDNMKENLKNIIKNKEDQNRFFDLIDAYISIS